MDKYRWCQWLLAYWPVAIPVVINILNAVLKHYGSSTGVKKFVNMVLDILSLTTRKDSPGTIKIPLTKSKEPPK